MSTGGIKIQGCSHDQPHADHIDLNLMHLISPTELATVIALEYEGKWTKKMGKDWLKETLDTRIKELEETCKASSFTVRKIHTDKIPTKGGICKIRTYRIYCHCPEHHKLNADR